MRGAVLLVVAVALAAAGAWLALRPKAAARSTPLHLVPASEGPAEVEAAMPTAAPRPRIVGKVIGDPPLEGVVVRWEGASGATDGKGAYRIDIAAPEKAVEARLVAEAPDGRVGFGRAWLESAREESRASDIALAPSAGVLFVTEPRVACTLELSSIRDPFPVPLPLLRAEAGEARRRLAIGKYELIARADGFGRTTLAFEVAADTREVSVPLAPERTLKVLVRSKASGMWVLGARLRLHLGWPPYGTPDAFTDAVGAATLRGLNREDKLMLDVVDPGEAPQEEVRGPSPRRRHPVPADMDEMLVEIDPPRRVSWPIETGDIPPPPDGTVIPLRKSSGTMVTPPAQGVMRGGRLCTEGWPPMAAQGEALGPEGTIARLYCGMGVDEGKPTKFLRGSDITVVVRKPDGAPAAGVNVAIFDEGNNLKAQSLADAEGVAKLEKLEGRRGSLCVLGGSQFQREPIGTVDLRKGDVRVEYTLLGRRRVEIRVLVDGAPALPAGRQLSFDHPLEQFAADEAQGLMTGLLALGAGTGRVTAFCAAPGFVRETSEIDVPPGDEPIRHTFTLRRGIDLRVHRVGTPPERFHVSLQRENGGSWFPAEGGNVFPRRARQPTTDGWMYPGLEPGSYRLRGAGATILATATLSAGGPACDVTIDYSKIAAIRGRVEMPKDGGWFSECHLRLEGEGVESEDPGPMGMVSNALRPDAKTGTFEVFVPGDRKVKLSVGHPRLMSHPERGFAETVSGVEDVVLVLVEGPTVRFRIPAHFETYAERYRTNPKWARPQVEVRLFRGEPNGRPEFTLFADAADREWRASGFLPGTYTVWIDVPESVPVARRDVRLTEDADLGDLPLEPGSTLRVRVLVKEPFAAPSMNVFARRLGQPEYSRAINASDDVLVVPGIGPGRYAVTSGINTGMFGPGGPRRLLDEEIEFDGATDVERTIDLR